MDIDTKFLVETPLHSIPGYPQFGIYIYPGMTESEVKEAVKKAVKRLSLEYSNGGG